MKPWTGPLLAGVLATATGAIAATVSIPQLIMSMAVKGMAARGAINAMVHGKLSTPDNQPIVRPSPDLAYSSCPFDVSGGPVEVLVVPVAGRYSSLSIFDGRTDVVFVRNDIQAQGKPYSVVIARAGQSVPVGREVVRVDQDRGIALIRLLLATPSELSALEPQRERSRCGPLR